MNKFKVGDSVSGITNVHETCSCCEITEVDYSDGYYKVLMKDGITQWCEEEDIKIVEYTWTSKFNIGDMVVDEDGVVQTVVQIIAYIGFEKKYIEYETEYGFYFENKLELYIEPQVKEVTMEELEDILGYKIKIVKEV